MHIGLSDYNYETRSLGAKTKKNTFSAHYETEKQGPGYVSHPTLFHNVVLKVFPAPWDITM
jgi:hypothetical protein